MSELEERGVLYIPTVGELVALLQKYPPDLPLRIEDADTLWTILDIQFKVEDDIFWLYGDYGDMTSESR